MRTDSALWAKALLLPAVAAAGIVCAEDMVVWDFDNGPGSAMPSQVTTTSITAGQLTRGSSLGHVVLFTNVSPSAGYPCASGGCNAGATARTGALTIGDAGSAYFEFTLTPGGNFAFCLEEISFGSRSTSTGPQAFAIRTSQDGFATDLASGILAADAKWQFCSVSPGLASPAGTALIFRVYGHGGSGTPASGTANWRIDDLRVAFTLADDDTLEAPRAFCAANVTADGFTARWSAVDGAGSYLFDLFSATVTGTVAATTVLAESFDGFASGSPDGGAHSSDVSGKLDNYTAVTGWSGYKVYQAGGAVKVGTGSDAGWLMTPAMDLANHDGNFSISFSACAWAGDATDFKLFLANGAATNQLAAIGGLDNAAYSFRGFHVDGCGGAADSHLIFAARQASKARFFLDGLLVEQGGLPGVEQTNHVCQGAVVGVSETNIVLASPGVYYYRVRAASGSRVSGFSNVVRVDTMAPAAAPTVVVPPPQEVRVGGNLAVALGILPGGDDAVTATNAMAVTEVAGEWSLVDGVFSFAPRPDDVGTRVFAFAVLDKDGWGDSASLTVTVRRAQVSAIVAGTLAGEYAPDFAALGCGLPEWDNYAWPLPGWSAYANGEALTMLRTGSGTGTTGGLYAWQAGGTYSLGSLASGKKDYIYGFALTNATGAALVSVTVSFLAEQWRVASAQPQALAFEYSVSGVAAPLWQGEWHPLAPLEFVAPLVTNASQAAGAVYAARRLAMRLPRPVAAGEVLRLRWVDVDDAGSDHAFGVNDVRVGWVAGVMPQAISVGWEGSHERFDELGGNAPCELPWLWRAGCHATEARVSGAYADGTNSLAFISDREPDFSVAGSYNFGAALPGDRAAGALPGTGARSMTISAIFANGTAELLRRWDVVFHVEKYRRGVEQTAVQLLYSTDGINWLPVGGPTLFAADDDEGAYVQSVQPGMTAAVQRMVEMPTPLPPQAVFYLAWQIAAAEGNPQGGMQALAIDDVFIRPRAAAGTVLHFR